PHYPFGIASSKAIGLAKLIGCTPPLAYRLWGKGAFRADRWPGLTIIIRRIRLLLFLWIGASLWVDGDKVRRTWMVRRHQKEAPHLRGRSVSLKIYRLPCALLRLAKKASR